jgi:hypothetical protein
MSPILNFNETCGKVKGKVFLVLTQTLCHEHVCGSGDILEFSTRWKLHNIWKILWMATYKPGFFIDQYN